MITPKEKAIELVNKYLAILFGKKYLYKKSEYFTSKQCALIAVNEIIDAIDWHEFENPDFEYWQEVKQEIETL